MMQPRLIKSFVRREGRMTPGQQRGLDQAWPHYGLTTAMGLLAFNQVFGHSVDEVILEIGFGMGQSLLTLAQQNPTAYFIGVEVHRPGVGKLLAQLQAHQLQNVRLYQEDVVEVLNRAIPDASLNKILIYFPDPWPKKRHHKRRLIQTNLVALLYKKLCLGGEVYLATDWEDYAYHMQAVFRQVPGFRFEGPGEGFIDRPAWRPLTKFEARGQRLGHGVWDLRFIKHELSSDV